MEGLDEVFLERINVSPEVIRGPSDMLKVLYLLKDLESHKTDSYKRQHEGLRISTDMFYSKFFP